MQTGRDPAVAVMHDQRDDGRQEGGGDRDTELEELRETLNKRDRRISNLQGQRDQLTSLLQENTDMIQSLNRELGRHERSSAIASPGAMLSRWLARGSRLAEKMQGAGDLIGRARQFVGSALPSKEPKTASGSSTKVSLVPHQKTKPARPILAVVIVGLPSGEIEAILPNIESMCEKEKLTPLLLTDNDGFEHFRTRSMIFEYLPPKDDQERFGSDLHWELYFQRRLAIIRRKWNPCKIITFGHTGSEIVRLWRDSAFESLPIPVAG